MDNNNFNNFFDDHESEHYERVPVYHTPSPKQQKKPNLVAILCIVVAAIMCIVVVVNVIVLASLKDQIAREYADNLTGTMRDVYEEAVQGAIADTDIIQDVTDSAARQVINSLSSTIGENASKHVNSVCKLYMYTSSTASTSNYSGIATAFLISDTDSNGKGRYLATNAHCVRYVASTRTGGGIFGGGYSYSWTSYAKILCVFEGESRNYTTEIVAYGGYSDSDSKLAAENNMGDLAILRITGAQPSNEAHPSLRLQSGSAAPKRGTPVALIGNPQGIQGIENGEVNSVTSGTITLTGISFAGEGGTFIMTDAAVNNGNSGGPMLDSRGVVVGVVESKFASSSVDNMGFAIAASTLQEFIEWAQNAAHNSFGRNIVIDCDFVVAVSE